MNLQHYAGGIFNIIFILGIIQAVFSAIVILTLPRGNKKANRMLFVILLISSLSIAFHLIGQFEIFKKTAHHQYIIALLLTAIGPSLFLYCGFLTKSSAYGRFSVLAHFIPFAAVFIFILISIFIPFDENIADFLLYGFLMIQIPVYLFLSLKLLHNHGRIIKENFSYLEKISLNWLKLLIICFLIIFIVFIAVLIFFKDHDSLNAVFLLFSIIIYITAYMGMRQPEIFSKMFESGLDEIPYAKYRKSTLTDELSEIYYQKLLQSMKEEKYYLINDITLPKIAEFTGISVHHLSQIINQKQEKNFFEFLNAYRVEEVKRLMLLPENKNFTLISIGFDSGFNSVSSFNSVFKKFTGLTPGEFRKRHP